MKTTFFFVLILVLLFLVLATLLISYICFRIAFYASRKEPANPEEYSIPEGEIYEPFRPLMENWAREVRAMPREEMTIRSFDGLTLHGRYYEYAPGAPMEIMFHGYRGTAERDLSGGVQRCFMLGRSCLIVDQRCSGQSGGHVISFGINEHRDCLAWVNHAVKRFGPDVKIILTGISMGAATVLMTADKNLPENVIGILADCGFTSPKAIIQKVIRQMGLPPKPCYPFVKLAAKVFGRFDLEEHSAIEAMKNSRVPVIFFHGEDDDFVPCDMSRENFEACTSRKRLVTVPGAGHGLSFPMDQQRYLREAAEFFGPQGSCKN